MTRLDPGKDFGFTMLLLLIWGLCIGESFLIRLMNLSKPVVRVTNRPVGQFGQHVGRDSGQDRLSLPEPYGLAEFSPSLRHLITAGGCIFYDRRQFSA